MSTDAITKHYRQELYEMLVFNQRLHIKFSPLIRIISTLHLHNYVNFVSFTSFEW